MSDQVLLCLCAVLVRQDTIIKLSEENARTGLPVGLDINSGDSLSPEMAGIWFVDSLANTVPVAWIYP